MRAVYEVCTCDGDDIVDRVLIDVSGDPDDSAICSQAVKAAGYDSDARCPCGAGSAYYAHFAGYASHTDTTTVEVPIVAIEVIAAILNNTRQALDEGKITQLRDLLVEAGCLECSGYTVNPVHSN